MSHHHHHHYDSEKNIKTAFFLNFGFTIIEIVGGIFTNSMAIIADAIHDLGDSISLGLAWYLQHLSKRGKTPKYTYGYKRFSVLGAFITSLILIVGSTIILSKAIPRFFSPEPTNVEGMLLLAVLGVIVNGAAVLKTKSGTSLNERVVSLHLLEDVLGWIAVLIGSIFMYFFDLPWIDPLLSLLIAIYVLKNVLGNLKQIIRIIMQGVPVDIDIKNIENIIDSFPEVKNYDHLHLWSMDGEEHVLSVEITVPNKLQEIQISQLVSKIKAKLEPLEVHEATIEVNREVT